MLSFNDKHLFFLFGNHATCFCLFFCLFVCCRLYLIFEFLEMDLRKYIEKLPDGKYMNMELVKSYMHQINTAILFCHCRRILHRDLKPQNLLITKDGIIKVTNHNCSLLLSLTLRVFIGSRFWFGSNFWGTSSRVHTWSGNIVVSGPRNSFRLFTLLLSRRHLVNGLYFCGNGHENTTIPRRFGNRSIIPNFPVASPRPIIIKK